MENEYAKSLCIDYQQWCWFGPILIVVILKNKSMCADNIGSSWRHYKNCEECGESVDENGDSRSICAYSPDEEPCPTCGHESCDESC